jgi:myo-inositol-1(or 4)-monophosphatase
LRKYTELLHVARDAAGRAADYVRSVERPPNPADWALKGTADFVTEVDRHSEILVTETLLAAFPDSTIVGEELTPASGTSESGLSWVVDPLDGTTNFLHGYPAYAVSIAAVADGELAAGVVVNVDRGIEFYAAAGEGAWCGDIRLRVSETTDTTLALIGTGFPFKSLDKLPQYTRQFSEILQSTSGIRRAGSAALDLVDVAIGRFDGFWELSLAPWDVAAGTLLVREAGGLVTDTHGSNDVVHQGPIVAGNPPIHAWLMAVVGEGGQER